MKPRRQRWAVVGRVALCLALLGWVFHTICVREGRQAWERQGKSWTQLTWTEQWRVGWSYGPGELWETLTLVEPVDAAVSLVFMGLTIGLGMLRWRMVLAVQGLQLRLGRATEISLVAHFFNSFLLGSTGGDLIKAYYAARETHHLKTEAVVTVFVDRLIGLLAMLLFASAMLLLNLELLRAQPRLAAVAGFILVMLLAGTALAGLSFWGGLSRRWPRARDRLRHLPKGPLLERSLEACRRFGKEPGFLLKTFGLSMILNAVCVFQIMALARGLGLEIPGRVLFAVVPTIICISALPITPSGLGVRENLYVWTLATPQLGVPPTYALSLSLLAYAGSLVWSVVGAFVYLTFRRRHRLAEVVEVESETPN